MPGSPVWGPGWVGIHESPGKGWERFARGFAPISYAATTVTPKEQLCYLVTFATKIGDNGYYKLGALVAMETTQTKLGATVTRLPVLAHSASLLPRTARSADHG